VGYRARAVVLRRRHAATGLDIYYSTTERILKENKRRGGESICGQGVDRNPLHPAAIEALYFQHGASKMKDKVVETRNLRGRQMRHMVIGLEKQRACSVSEFI